MKGVGQKREGTYAERPGFAATKTHAVCPVHILRYKTQEERILWLLPFVVSLSNHDADRLSLP